MSTRVNSETPLTALQQEIMGTLAKHEGKTVDVQTSRLDLHPAGFDTFPLNWSPVGKSQITVLRGLEKRGRIKIVDSYWQGARVTVL